MRWELSPYGKVLVHNASGNSLRIRVIEYYGLLLMLEWPHKKIISWEKKQNEK